VDPFLLVLLALMAVLLFVMPARQRKKMQAQAQALQESLRIGTPVMTTSGIHGTVAALADKTVDLELAPGVVVTFARPAIMEVRRPVVAPGDEGSEIEGPGNGAAGGRPADGTL
jgi:preprotein translocase subunit YajC